MASCDFQRKINFQRPYGGPIHCRDEHDILRVFESDRGRIVNSPVVRRLQQKTQVFPLERNASVRTRLTHSLEVQQVGRYIAKEVLSLLKAQRKLELYGLTQLSEPFESIVEMACLLHDIGNPPFGHFGEAALCDWFGQFLATGQMHSVSDAADRCQAEPLRLQPGDTTRNQLRREMRQDLASFDGNAQAIRLVHTLMKMNLTWAQVGCILKYTRPAWWLEPIPAAFSYLMKKPGFFLSERAYIAQLNAALQLQPHHRFPLTYIMEAADDISYCLADLEDAVEKHILTVDQLYDYLYRLWPVHQSGDLFDRVINGARKKSQSARSHCRSDDQFFMYLRVYTVANLVPHVARGFVAHLPAIFDGAFNQALLEDGSPACQLLDIFKRVARRYIFRHPDVEQLELQGYRVIRGLLEIYQPLLMLSTAQFQRLVSEDELRTHPIETRLFHKLASRHRLAYVEALQQLDARGVDYPLWEWYYRSRLIQDYISGMTDLYAWDEYRRLMAVA